MSGGIDIQFFSFSIEVFCPSFPSFEFLSFFLLNVLKTYRRQIFLVSLLYDYALLLSTIILLIMLAVLNLRKKNFFIKDEELITEFSPLVGVLRICSKFIGEHPCQGAISTKLLCNFIEIALRRWFSPVNFQHIFRTSFPKSTSERLFLALATNFGR